MNFARDLIMQVRELMDRHLDTLEIAHRLHLDPTDVQTIIDIINQILT